jgi:hypothetical protein
LENISILGDRINYHEDLAKRIYEVITHNPNSVNPGETLYVKIPQLERGQVVVPKSIRFTFKLTTSSKASSAANALQIMYWQKSS